MINVKNGTAYDDNGDPIILHVVDVDTSEGHNLIAEFPDGAVKMYDMSKLLDTEAFSPLRDHQKFETVTLDHGVPTWEEANVDLAPETIYEYGKIIEFA